MERFIIIKGVIFKAEGKIIKRYKQDGTLREFFRTTNGEYPIEKTKVTLTKEQQRQYDLLCAEYNLEKLYIQKTINPEGTELIDKWISEAKEEIRQLRE